MDYREKNDVFTGLSLIVDAGDELKVSGTGKPEFVDVQDSELGLFDI